MFAPVSNQTGFLPEEGKYTVECLRIEEAPDNGYGIGVRWILALYEGADRVKNDSGFEFEFWQTTSPNMGPKARARQYVEAFLGRPLDDGERINPNDLPGKRCSGMVIHEESKTKPGVQNAKLVSMKPLVSSAPNGQTSSGKAKPAPSGENVEALRTKLRGLISKAEANQTPSHLDFISLNVDIFDVADCKEWIHTVTEELLA